MNITKLELKNFRNYEALELELQGGVTVLYGDNAQGKTNVLEAVYLCCTGRSHRTRQDRELIRRDAEFAQVSVTAQRRDGRHDVELLLPAAGRRRIRIAGQEASRSGELMGHVTGVLFSPEDLRTVKDGPAERRRFVDMALSQLKPAYYYALQRHARALKQRNEALRAIAANPRLLDTLDAWDEQLALAGDELVRYRAEYVARLSAVAAEIHADVAPDSQPFSIEYRPDAEDSLRALQDARNQDLRRMSTTVGAHRDEIRLMLGDMDVRAFGSQGQQRTAALAMRLAEMRVMRDATEEWPVLMLDDVMSELDPSRRRQLVAHLDGVQTLVTCTDLSDLAGARPECVYRVENAALTRE